MLRIDVYHKDTFDGRGGDVKKQQTLYACLASSASKEGVVLTVGRKTGDVVIAGDKSISRQHVALRIVSQHKEHQEPIDEDGEIIVSSAAAPKSQEEINACKDSFDGMCICIDDLGAKFGTSIVTEGTKDEAKKFVRNESDDETGDETDDDEVDRFSSQLSITSQKIFPNPDARIVKKLESTSSTVLACLSKTDNKVVVECGRNQSTIVVTRIPINVAFTRVDTKVKKLWLQRLYALGATCVDDLSEMTHLIAKDKTTTPKLLATWYSRKPILPAKYLERLWERTKPDDPMPNDNDEDLQMQSKDAFWNVSPNPNLFSSCILFVLVQSELVVLCRAAGCKIVDVSNLSETQFEAKIKKYLKPDGCFFIDTHAQKLMKCVKKLKQLGVSAVTQKVIAASATKQELLVDTDGNPVGTESQREDSNSLDEIIDDKCSTKKDEIESPGKHLSQKNIAKSSGVVTSLLKPQDYSEKDVAGIIKDSSSSTTGTKRSCGELHEKGEIESSDQNGAREKKRKKKGGNEASGVEMEDEGFKDIQKPKQKREEMGKGRDSSEKVEEKTKKVKKRRLESHDKENDGESYDGRSKRKKLKTMAGGWFVAAPSGAKRKQYRRSHDEIAEKIGVSDLAPAAPSEGRKNLIVRRPTSGSASNQYQSSTAEIVRRGDESNAVDFKRFRKNRVKKSIFGTSRITLRSVLPKESDRERELELKQRHVDESERIADELFNDRSGGMKDYFKPAKKIRKTSRR